MSPRRYRAWRFVHPDLVAAEATGSAGLQLSARGRIDVVEEDESVRQAILLLLSTSPGERVMRPEYGCHLRRLVFSPNDDTTAGLAIHYVRQALARWEPRIDVLALDATRDPESSERLQIALHYRVRATNRTGILAYPLELAGGPP
ncbi:MAG TPA: GPW/gp25 family protein [Candidatus Limnocylindrales bacterium]|jgi:hypothetical protein|nr:GPW/gp25 family protein [Candidatus Limnocylindrales bacterium]